MGILAEFHSVEVLAVAPAVEQGQAHSLYIVVGVKGPMTLFCVADIFFHNREDLSVILSGGKAKEAYASLAASNWRRS